MYPFSRSKSSASPKSRQRSRRNGDSRWSIDVLEKRVMLAADCGVAIADASAGSAVHVVVPATDVVAGDRLAAAQTSGIVFFDAAVSDFKMLEDGLQQGHEVVLLRPGQSGLNQITEVLATRTNVASIHIIAHGQAGQLQLAGEVVDLDAVNRLQTQIQSWSRALTSGADILIYGCETGSDTVGLQFMTRIAELTGADVAASTDKTGSASQHADWDLERHVGTIEAGLAFSSTAREAYQATLPITIRAAGSTGEEQMQLQIDQAVVATFDNVGTGFADYTFDIDGVDADQVRVVFTNDLYRPDEGIDRNLDVDRISIDGVVFETEDPAVFSTGSWLPEDGIVSGFRQSETLNANGYFQYAETGVNPGDPSGLVINEIHYNPGPDGVVDGDAEFIELYNSSDQAIDLGGMSFVGFDLTFAAGTSIDAGQYAIVAPSTELAESTWGVTPIAEFVDGGLSGGGELIQLIAADGVTVIDEFEYTDEAPWTPLPDGNGPSLELRDWTLDNSLAENWSASQGGPTPAAENSVFGNEVTDSITDIVVTPGEVLPGQDFTIGAKIEGATTASLVYKVGFGEEQTIAMTNVTGDSWEAVVPGSDAGTLIRYRIESDVAVAPFDDTINYFGLVVSPTDISGNELPLFQFFVDDAEFTELTTTELALTNTKIDAVVYYNGQVIDNATVRVRGGDHSRAFFPKKSLKFELPKGYAIDVGGEGTYPIDEFGINADFGDWSMVAPDVAWDVFNAETESFTTSFFVRAEVNGDFHGVFRFQELYDGAWRDANGLGENDEFYKADGGGFGSSAKFDKKVPKDTDFTTINELNEVLTAAPSAAKTAYLHDNVDVPNVINHMALTALVRHDDQKGQNFYMLRDDDTGLWSIVEWDLDRLWLEIGDETEGGFTTPEPVDHELLNSVWEVPEFQEMYWRRMQTLVDTYLSEEGRQSLVNRFDELVNQIGATNSTLDFEKWNRNDIFANQFWRNEFQAGLDMRVDAFQAETRLPGTASGVVGIVINELHYNPLDDDAEFIELFNNSSTESVDLSSWTIDGVDLTIGFGTVILPGQRIVFTENLASFRTQAPGNILIGGQYDGGLKGSGELITLSNASGNVIDQVDYLDTDPWPSEPDGNGFTLSLINPNLDNSLAGSWVASNQINGTPGAANGLQTDVSTLEIFAAGTTGQEILRLDIAGQSVATFDLAALGGQSGDLSARNFIELTWSSDTAIDPSDVRISFLNDAYDPENGIDANLAIDRIDIDGVVYETEANDVFSTGTYLSADGIVPGFRQSEILHTNGYFQYAVESQELFADGNVIQLQNFQYNAFLSTDGYDAVTSTTNNLATQWQLIDAGDNEFKLLNLATARYLDGDSQDVDTSSRSAATGTDWRFIESGDGLYYLFNPRYDDYVDANGANQDVAWDPGALDPDDLWQVILV